jgi:hypothetical protein
MFHPSEPITPSASSLPDNGILARVPGSCVARAQSALPDAAGVTEDEICVEVDAGWLGQVRLIFRKYRYTRPMGNFSAVAWSCRHAEPVAAHARGNAEDSRRPDMRGGDPAGASARTGVPSATSV